MPFSDVTQLERNAMINLGWAFEIDKWVKRDQDGLQISMGAEAAKKDLAGVRKQLGITPPDQRLQ